MCSARDLFDTIENPYSFCSELGEVEDEIFRKRQQFEVRLVYLSIITFWLANVMTCGPFIGPPCQR